MAKAILKYDLSDEDDILQFARATKSNDLAFSIWEIMHNTKKGLEWQVEQKELTKYEVIDLVFEKIQTILNEHNVNIDELVR